MRITQVHGAVKALLGEPVSCDSVAWVLTSDVRGATPRFVRVGRGRYVLGVLPSISSRLPCSRAPSLAPS